MRKVWLSREDFELFHTDITPYDYEFFRTHNGAFKRMWQEQRRQFWSIFVSTFEYFIWNYGILKDFPMKAEEIHDYVDEILFYVRDQFVDGKVSSAKALVMDCVIVTQNRHCIALLDKTSYSQNPFYMKETREVFRNLFGPPNSKRTFMKVLCGLPVYIKFAGAAVMLLRRWLGAPDVPSDEESTSQFFQEIHIKKFNSPVPYDPLLALKARSAELMPRPRPALEAPPLSTSNEKKGSKDAVDTKNPSRRSKKTASGTARKDGKADTETDTKADTKTDTKKSAAAKATTDEQADKNSVSQEEAEAGEGAKGPPDTDTPQEDQKDGESGDKDSVAVVGAGDGEPGAEAEEGAVGEEAPLKKKKKKRKRRKKKAVASVEEEDLLGLDEDVPEERKEVAKDVLGLDEDVPVVTKVPEGREERVADVPVVAEVKEGREEVVGVPEVMEGKKEKVLDVPEVAEMRKEEVDVPVVTEVAEGRETEEVGVPEVTEGVVGVTEEVVGVPEVMEQREEEVVSVTEVAERREEAVEGVLELERDVPVVAEDEKETVENVLGLDEDVSVVPVVPVLPEEKEEAVVENVQELAEDVSLLPKMTEDGVGVETVEEMGKSLESQKVGETPEEGGTPELVSEVGEAQQEEKWEEQWEPGGEGDGKAEADVEIAGEPEEEAVESGRQFESVEVKAESDIESSGESGKMEVGQSVSPVAELDAGEKEVEDEAQPESEEVKTESDTERSSEPETKEVVSEERSVLEAKAESDAEQAGASEVAGESGKQSESTEVVVDVGRDNESEKEVESGQQPETPPPTIDEEEEELVAKQEEVVAKGSSDREEGLEPGKWRLHVCAFCDAKETSAKSFKRCQKCRGKTNPRYYCSRDCQAKHWKTHKLDHKSDVVKTAEN